MNRTVDKKNIKWAVDRVRITIQNVINKGDRSEVIWNIQERNSNSKWVNSACSIIGADRAIVMLHGKCNSIKAAAEMASYALCEVQHARIDKGRGKRHNRATRHRKHGEIYFC